MSVAARWLSRIERFVEAERVTEPARHTLEVPISDLRQMVDHALEFERTAERVQAVMPGVFDALAQAKTESEKLYERLAELERDLQLAQLRVQAANAQLVDQAKRIGEQEAEITRMVERDYFDHKALFAEVRDRCISVLHDLRTHWKPGDTTDSVLAEGVRRINAMELDP